MRKLLVILVFFVMCVPVMAEIPEAPIVSQTEKTIIMDWPYFMDFFWRMTVREGGRWREIPAREFAEEGRKRWRMYQDCNSDQEVWWWYLEFVDCIFDEVPGFGGDGYYQEMVDIWYQYMQPEPQIADLVIYNVDPYKEYIDLYSRENEPVNLAGWVIHSKVGGEWFKFDLSLIRPHANGIVRVWSGPLDPIYRGAQQTHLWEGFVWDNSGDMAELISPDGTIVDTWAY